MPSIGRKSAQRLAYHLLQQERSKVERLANSILEAKDKVSFCCECHQYAEGELCEICSDPRRQSEIICVVEKPFDVWLLEKAGVFRGKYHVLGGALSPIEGVGPDSLQISHLLERLKSTQNPEVILALSTSAEGETTVLYLSRLLQSSKVKISRLSRGIPVGSSLEYVDTLTMQNAFDHRVSL